MRVAHGYIFDCQIFAPEGMKVPAGAVLEGAVLEQDALAVPQADHHRAEEGLDFLLVQRRIRIVQAACSGTGFGISLVREPDLAVFAHQAATLEDFFPLVVGDFATLYLAPELPAAVDHSSTGNGDVGRALGMNGAQAPADVKPLEVGVNNGVKVLIRIEYYDGVLVDVQFDVALKADGAGAPYSGRHNQLATALLRELSDCIGEGLGVQSFAIRHAAEVAKVHAARRNAGSLNLRHLEGKVFVKYVFCIARSQKGDCGKEKHQFAGFHRLSVNVSILQR